MHLGTHTPAKIKNQEPKRQNEAFWFLDSGVWFFALALLLSATQQTTAQCSPQWVQDVGNPGLNGTVFTLASFDDGSGPALYVGGFFSMAGNVATYGIARWNGSVWSGVGGSGLDVSGLSSMLIYDDGSGPALHVGGYFYTISGVAARCIAKWNGSTWSPLGAGIPGTVYAMSIFDDGTGPALYAAGNFASAGGAPAANVARWKNSTWSPLSSGTNDQVWAMTTFDDGTGSALYIGGIFTVAGGATVGHVAKWNGSGFSPVGVVGPDPSEHLHVLGSFNDGGAQYLFGGGLFTTVDGHTAKGIARRSNTSWQPIQNGLEAEPKAFAIFDDRTGGGSQFFVSGDFTRSGTVTILNAAKWNGSNWEALGAGLNGPAYAATPHDLGQGQGPSLYIGGAFTTAGGLTANHIARWAPAGNPAIVQGPSGAVVIAGQSVSFSGSAVGNQPLAYRWQRGATPLSDGGHISGAFTPTLTVDPATAADAGTYRLVATNTCGSATSAAATLTVNPACNGDTYADAFVDGLDIPGFVNCVLTGQGCAATDLDGDGQTADVDTDDDLAAFVVKLSRPTSVCP